MVAVSFVLVLALVSSTVVAQPGTDGCTGLFACFRRRPTFVPTESIHRWIPLDEETPTPTSDEDPADIGLSYILQNLNLRSNEFKVMKNFTDSLVVTHVYGIPRHKGSFIRNLYAAAHVKNGQDAVKAAVDCLGVPFYNAIAPVKESYSTDDGDILVLVFQLKDNPTTRWIEVKVNANTGAIVSKKDVKRDFTYTAIELPNESFNDGFSTVVNPENLKSSPNGWTEGYKLKGNNALVKFKRGKTLKTTIRGRFDGVFDPVLPPQTPKNLEAGAVNAFYAANMVHDVLYPYGFNEPAGNFQRIISTGSPYWWSTDKMCMTETESRGLGEGYSDMVALIFTTKPEDTRNTIKVIAEYVEGDQRGNRRREDMHNLGTIWASLLVEVYWSLVNAYGFSANLHDATQKKGNIIFLQLFVRTLMIQPCNPTFESAYDAMLVADDVYYGGIHKHLIRKGFVKRGLDSVS
ncbi:hypothetical protein BSLG_010859 [Batrachochytrium salamandrivorans]|nr:hypothetical protein BSLG_010859 [Batrachochytrium salamandrivorans]